ncbi:DUF6278 family protein [Cryobacterium zhongshanensis]|uniref:DUF6278 family protein n=1 Tax=Cryobacterium zhongshanensis TaxID=2928153 RepID=A0AA41QXE3_9MICO|nr:DUF6278 family protein [Cryobacterium zhongshanensis]MCI4658288.1 DUF6278 family protein [Cryobacterium zhongshanensis]
MSSPLEPNRNIGRLTMAQDPRAKEPIQRHPPGISRNSAPYTLGGPRLEDISIRNIGGYDDLTTGGAAAGAKFSRDANGLRTLDNFIDASPQHSRDLAAEIAMFYGDVLTHTIAGSHWIVIDASHPEVRIAPGNSIDVVRVAMSRLESNAWSLLDHYDHARALAAGSDG